MNPVLRLDDPIVPGESLGGFELGRNIGDYHELLRTAFSSGVGGQEPAAGLWGFQATFTFAQLFKMDDAESHAIFDAFDEFTARRRAGEEVELPSLPERPPLGDPAVEVVVDIRDGVIVGLFAERGYEGTLLEDVRVGMTYPNVAERLPLEWSERVVGRVVTGTEGVALHFERDDFDWTEDELADRHLESIGVFLPERTMSGRVGL